MLAPVRTIEIGDIRVTVDAIPDDIPTNEVIAGTAMDNEKARRQLDRGELVHFAVRVEVERTTVFLKSHSYHHCRSETLATGYLGGCIYESFQAFADDPYLQDIVQECIRAAKPLAPFAFFVDATSEHGNVIAVDRSIYERHGELEGLAATFPHENSGVSWTAFSEETLGSRIEASEAEKMHPRLFERLRRDNEAYA